MSRRSLLGRRSLLSRRSRQQQPSDFSKLLRDHRQVAYKSLLLLLKAPISSLMTGFVIAVSLLLPALLLGLSGNISTVLDEFENSARITLFLAEDLPELEGMGVSDDLLTRNDIAAVQFISKNQALVEFSVSSGFAAVLSEIEDNPLPAAIVITPTDSAAVTIDGLVQYLQDLPAVAELQIDSQWIARLHAVSNLVTNIGQLLSLIVVLGLFFIVGNTIKLAIENRKNEVRVIKLIGGTDAYVARPFLYAGLFYGAFGGALAFLLQTLVLYSFSASLQELTLLYASDFSLQGFGLGSGLILLIAGSLIGWTGALLASIRHIAAVGV